MIESGIYKIINTITSIIYVGSAVNIEERWYIHKWHLNKNTHYNTYLQRSWNKYGGDNFKFEIIELVENKEDLIKREQYFIDLHKAYDRNVGYNLTPTAGSLLGFKWNEEQRKRNSESQRGKIIPEEVRKKISKTNTGKIRTKETCERISKVKTGKKRSIEFKRKMSKIKKGNIPWNKGIPWQEEIKQKISKTLTGRKIPKEIRDGIDLRNSKPFLVYKSIRIQEDIDRRSSIYLKGDFIGEFLNQSDCAKSLGLLQGNINSCLHGRKKAYNGYIFEYKENL